jgi:hypothetical protein
MFAKTTGPHQRYADDRWPERAVRPSSRRSRPGARAAASGVPLLPPTTSAAAHAPTTWRRWPPRGRSDGRTHDRPGRPSPPSRRGGRLRPPRRLHVDAGTRGRLRGQGEGAGPPLRRADRAGAAPHLVARPLLGLPQVRPAPAPPRPPSIHAPGRALLRPRVLLEVRGRPGRARVRHGPRARPAVPRRPVHGRRPRLPLQRAHPSAWRSPATGRRSASTTRVSRTASPTTSASSRPRRARASSGARTSASRRTSCRPQREPVRPLEHPRRALRGLPDEVARPGVEGARSETRAPRPVSLLVLERPEDVQPRRVPEPSGSSTWRKTNSSA